MEEWDYEVNVAENGKLRYVIEPERIAQAVHIAPVKKFLQVIMTWQQSIRNY